MTQSTTETKILGLDDLSRQQLYELIIALKSQQTPAHLQPDFQEMGRTILSQAKEIAVLKTREKPAEVTEDVLYAEWFEDYEDQELDFYEWVFKKKLPNGLKIIEGARDGNTETAT